MYKQGIKQQETMALNAEKLKEILQSPTFKNKLMSAAYVDLKVKRLVPLPDALHSGMATADTLPLFRQVKMHNLPAGMYCQICYESSGKLTAEVVNEKKKQLCKGCRDKTMKLQDGETFTLQFILPPLTSTAVNLIFPLIRKSAGGKVDLDYLKLLYSFVRNWSGIPNRLTHVQWIVDILGSNANALALHSDMNWRLGKFSNQKRNKDKEMFDPISNLLPRIRATMRMNMDSVTIAVPTMATFTVKTSNLEVFLAEAEQFGIPMTDIFFVMYGTSIDTKSVSFDPVRKSGTEILSDIKALKSIPDGEVEKCEAKWLLNLDYNCRVRVLGAGLAAGRTICGGWKDFTHRDVHKARQHVQENQQQQQ